MTARPNRRPSRCLTRGAVCAAAMVAAVATLGGVAPVRGQDDGYAMPTRTVVGSRYGYPGAQNPPWHGSVAAAPAAACGPACHHCGGYGPACACMGGHGCGWLWAQRSMGYSLPPLFPRLHTLIHDGYLPTPPPVAMPRCHNCGAMIDAGF